jgi:hypothetical protein
MTHKLLIWSKGKEAGQRAIIETHINVSQEQIEKWAMRQYAEDHHLDSDREYWAEIDITIH